MKYSILPLLLFLSLPAAKAQFMEWSTPVPVTDSSHLNRNPSFSSFYGFDEWLFWDQQIDDNTTRICYKDLNQGAGAPEQVALEIPGAKLTHPLIIPVANGNCLAKIMYCINEGNDIDLKSIDFNSDGTFSAPVAISNLPGDDINLSSKDFFGGFIGYVAWENSGKVYVAKYLWESNSFTQPFAVDSGGACWPAMGSSLSYLKSNGNSTDVISSFVDYNSGSITITEYARFTVDAFCSHLSTSPIYLIDILAFQAHVGSGPSGIFVRNCDGYLYEGYNSPVHNFSEPALGDFLIGVKSGMYFLAFVTDSTGNDEIFAKEPWAEMPHNLSNWPGYDRSPKYFTSFPGGDLARANLFWESGRQGNSTIYYTYFDYPFGNVKSRSRQMEISIVPNPSADISEIRFRGNGEGRVLILDATGRQLCELPVRKLADESCSALWNGTNLSGSNVKPGFYIARVISGTNSGSAVMIRK